MQCPNCGTQNEDSATRCVACAHPLSNGGAPLGAMVSWETENGTRRSMVLNRSLTIGRTAGNDLVIPDSALSRQHARIEVSPAGFSIVDLGSLNGVFLNEERVDDAQDLRDGDEVRVGRTVVTINIPEGALRSALDTGTLRLDEDARWQASGGASSDRTMLVADDAGEATIFVETPAWPAGDEGAPLAEAFAEDSLDHNADADEEAPNALDGAPWPDEADERTIMAEFPAVEPEESDLPIELPVEDPAPMGPLAYLLLDEMRTPLYTAITVGRSEGNDIRIDQDRLMSRNHARFEAKNQVVWVEDLNSANGSFVNGERLTVPRPLDDGDEVRTGGTTFQFEYSALAAARSAAEALDTSGTLITDDDSDDLTLQGTDADSYIREAEVAEFQAMRGTDTEPLQQQQGESLNEYRLVVNFGPEAGRSFNLLKDVMVIGRAAPDVDYDIQLNDRAVSRPQAKILREPDGFVIHDLDSANGTWLNYTDELTAPRRLVDGDILTMGKTTLVYRVPANLRPTPPVQTLDPDLAQILTFFSLKGGVGTTTLAVNLAVMLRQMTNQSVLLIDLSIERGAVSVHLNLAPKLTLADIPTDPSVFDADVLQSVIVQHASGVDVLAAPPSPQSAELVTSAAISSILPIARAHYKWILIDTSTTFSELNLGVFDQSDLLMLVCAPDLTSLKVTQSSLDIFAALQIPAEKRVLVLNQVPARSHLHAEDIERSLGERIGLVVPHAGEAVLDSIDRGVPVAVASPNEPMVLAIDAFVAQLAQVKREAEVKPRRGGLGRWVQGLVSSLRR